MEQLEQRMAAGEHVTVEELSHAQAVDRLAELHEEHERTTAARAAEDQRKADLAAALDRYEAAADEANERFLSAGERFEQARQELVTAYAELAELAREATDQLRRLGLPITTPDQLVHATNGRVLLDPDQAMVRRDYPPQAWSYAKWLDTRRAERT